MKDNKKEKTDYIDYIIENVNDLPKSDRDNVLQLIYNSSARDKIQEKGNGVQIKAEYIPYDIVKQLYDLIKKKINDQQLHLTC